MDVIKGFTVVNDGIRTALIKKIFEIIGNVSV